MFTLKDTRKLKKSKRMIKNAKQKPSVNCEDKSKLSFYKNRINVFKKETEILKKIGILNKIKKLEWQIFSYNKIVTFSKNFYRPKTMKEDGIIKYHSIFHCLEKNRKVKDIILENL